MRALAALYRARVYAQQIVDGSLAPVNGARGIWLDAWDECFNIVDEGSDLINDTGCWRLRNQDAWSEQSVTEREGPSANLHRGSKTQNFII